MDDDILRYVEERFFPRSKEEDRLKDTDQRKTYDEVFDQRTLKVIYKLMTEGHFEIIDCPVSTGKEGNVFRAITLDDVFVAVKIYRTSTATFKHLLKYIDGDPRFSGFRSNKRKMLSAWAAKEFRNMKRMKNAGASVPEPIAQRDNIVVMEFLGKDGLPFPLLKDVEPENPQSVMDEIIHDYGLCYREANIIHGDFSEFNVMMDGDKPHIIDVGQGTLTSHPMSHEFLIRDRDNIRRFFKKKGVKTDPENLLKKMKGEA